MTRTVIGWVRHATSRLRRIVDRLTDAMAVLAAAGTCILVIAICYDVVSRRFLGGSVAGMLELSETLLVWIVFLGLPYAEKAGVHVRMTLVTSRLPDRVSQISRTMAYVMASAIVGWMAYASIIRAEDSFQRGEAKLGLLQWPVWPARMILAFGVTVLALQCVFRVIDVIRGRRISDSEDDTVGTAVTGV